ncbi:aminotransferase class V-fold PLP-dependent enzyme [Treponema succinifaciens]|uniref:Cysteine desulfurase n=1 Tax=Treponema succinifaciens (strain ATCC 33096 / DSM 2489 / 6091) TaxID=869209 RepID=F2NSA4_TRES6|nr:aminotransferase class V-fold PLP-dependent enzyme [Treponema succinifaciens]AEB14540.1 Cysteine desulfurase [Treponema succinifaciens DSM 2489]
MSFYFDNAATTFPKPECVYSSMDSFYRKHGGNAGRGQYKLAAESSKIIFETRGFIQKILCSPNKDVIFAPSATVALNMVIQGLLADEKKKTVYISPFEHNSVTRVLHHFEKVGKICVRQLFVSPDFEYDIEKINAQFAEIPPDIVIVSHASNVIGLVAPVLEIFAAAKKYGALTVTDIAQTAGLVPLDVANDLVDFAVFAGHKTLYGPFGIGGFAKNRNVALEPVLFGGTGVDSANQEMPENIPGRYEMGSQNICAVAGLHAAAQWFLQNQDEIRAAEEKNHRRLLEILRQYDFVKIAGPADRFSEKTKCIGVVSTVFDGYAAEDIGNVFDEMEIAVRTGLQCSPLAHKFLGTFPAGTVRFSVGYFTGEEDFCALEKAMGYIEENR